MTKYQIESIQFDERGLIPVVVQNAQTKEVLTVAYMNRESLEKTIETKTETSTESSKDIKENNTTEETKAENFFNYDSGASIEEAY